MTDITTDINIQQLILIVARNLCSLLIKIFVSLTILYTATGCHEHGQTSIQEYQQASPKLKDSFAYVDNLNRLGVQMFEQNIDSTFFYIKKVTDVLHTLNYPKGRADLLNNLGVFYDVKGNIQLSLRYYNDAYNMYVTLHDTANVVQTLMNIGMVYVEIGNNEKSIINYNNAVKIGEKLQNDSIMGLLYYNYILQHPDHFSADSINFYFNKIKSIGSKYNDQRLLIALDQLIADKYIESGKRDEGFSLLKQTISKAISNNFYYASMDMFADIGDRLSNTDSAEAIGYYLQALEIAKQKDYNIYVNTFTRKIYEFYKTKKDDALAICYSQELLNLIDKQKAIDNASSVDYIDYALKEKELEAIRAHSTYNTRLLILISIICGMAIIILIVLWRNWRNARNNAKMLRLQFEQSEITKDALDKMNRNYDKLIKTIAHDLRNPVGAIHSIASLMAEKSFDEETNDFILMLQASAAGSLDLINNLLNTDFEQQLKLEKESTHLDELLWLCVQLLSFRARDKKQELIYKAEKGISVRIDKNKIIRVLDNLIINAIKFSPEYASIYITLKQHEDKVVISVRDSGIGIPENLRDKIFNAFTIAKRNGTNGEAPFGLGLYLSREIIEAHGGTLYLNTQTDAGAEFIVELQHA